MDGVKKQLLPVAEQSTAIGWFFDHIPFDERRVRNGEVVLHGLPIGCTWAIILDHPQWMFDNRMPNAHSQVEVSIDSMGPQSISVKTVPIQQ